MSPSRDRRQTFAMVAVVALLHVLGFGALLVVLLTGHGSQALSVGLGFTAYMFGLRHAFDADHIAAIDNVTRKLAADGGRPRTVGFWFALGHSAMVLGLALLVLVATKVADGLLDDSSPVRRMLGMVGTLASGGFLYIIAIINVIVLLGIWRALQSSRHRGLDEDKLEQQLDSRGLLARVLRPVTRRITSPRQMLGVGALFGLGFDTATEVALLAMAGAGAVAGAPWYAVLTLPVLFAAGMTLMDSADGVFMIAAYDWALASPMRKLYYNLIITALSVIVALLIGTIQLVSVLHDDLGWTNSFSEWLSSISLDRVGFVIVGLFALVWAAALIAWRRGRLEHSRSI